MCRCGAMLKHWPVGSGDQSGLAGVRFMCDHLAANERIETEVENGQQMWPFWACLVLQNDFLYGAKIHIP